MNFEPILLSVADTAKSLGISKPMLYQMISDGRFGLIGTRFGRKRLFSTEELRNWVQSGCPSKENWLKMRTDDCMETSKKIQEMLKRNHLKPAPQNRVMPIQRNLPPSPGIYFVWEKSKNNGVFDIVYIGKTVNIKNRCYQKNHPMIDRNNLISWIHCSEDELDDLESRYIKCYSPLLNTIGKCA